MVSGTPSCSLSSMAVTPSSWWGAGGNGRVRLRVRVVGGQRMERQVGCRVPHLQVLFHLVVHLVQGLCPVLQQQGCLLVLPLPLGKLVLSHLLGGQAQRAQGLLGKGLGAGRGALSNQSPR